MTIGEIIETKSMAFVAESFTLNRPPALGGLVVVAEDDTRPYGVVIYGQTVGIDPSRRPVRQSTETVHDQAVYERHVELEHILRTEFGVALVGYDTPTRVCQHLPPRPPCLHFSVREATADEVRRFTNELQYLRLLLSTAQAGEVPPPQVLAAHAREVYRARGEDRAWLERAAQEIVALFKNDYEALLTVLYAMDPGVQL
jgi:hypothetical protein